jgi:hypothetical protein
MTSNLNEKIVDKEFTLQYYPSCIYDIRPNENKVVEYNGVRLKCDYIIDIVHMLVNKYFISKGKNKFVLYSEILKKRYGLNYNYYVDYLLYRNIIRMNSNYKIGLKSRCYSLNSTIFMEKITRIKNYNKFLLNKNKHRILNLNFGNDINLIDDSVKDKLIKDLYSIKINTNKSFVTMGNFDIDETDMDIYNKHYYSIESINNRSFHYSFDSYGRMHTNVTNLKSDIRKNCLVIDDEDVFEIDIKNSHPLFLAKLIYNTKSNWVNSDELVLYSKLVLSGEFYDYLKPYIGISDKKELKKFIYRVFYGKNSNDSIDSKFKRAFPTIYNFIIIYKNNSKSYKSLSHELQRMESNFVYNKLVKTIMSVDANIKVITVHDSIIFSAKYKSLVTDIFDKLYKEEFTFE